MQKTVSGVRGSAVVSYRERLSPSLWVIVSAAVAAPMAALVIAPIDTTLALVAGALVGVAIVVFLIAGSPVVQVSDGVLTAGRAHIDLCHTGEVTVLTGEDARHARGPGPSAAVVAPDPRWYRRGRDRRDHRSGRSSAVLGALDQNSRPPRCGRAAGAGYAAHSVQIGPPASSWSSCERCLTRKQFTQVNSSS